MKTKSLPAALGRYKLLVVPTLTFYFKLSWLILNLSFSLLLFCCEIIFYKINKKYFADAFLLVLILFSLIINFYLWQEKNNVKNIIKQISIEDQVKINSLKLQKQFLSLEEVEKQYTEHLDLSEQVKQNKALLINLSQLSKGLGDEEKALTYLEMANKI